MSCLLCCTILAFTDVVDVCRGSVSLNYYSFQPRVANDNLYSVHPACSHHRTRRAGAGPTDVLEQGRGGIDVGGLGGGRRKEAESRNLRTHARVVCIVTILSDLYGYKCRRGKPCKTVTSRQQTCYDRVTVYISRGTTRRERARLQSRAVWCGVHLFLLLFFLGLGLLRGGLLGLRVGVSWGSLGLLLYRRSLFWDKRRRDVLRVRLLRALECFLELGSV